MSAGQYSFCIYQGSTFKRTITYTDSSGTAVDLTGATIRMQARENVNSASTVIDLSTDTSGISITDAAAGEFEISLTASATAGLSFRSSVYDLEIEFTDGEVRRILAGTIELRPEVTR